MPATHQRLTRLLGDWAASGRISGYEVVYVDNGSTDRTAAVLEGLYRDDSHVNIVSLRRDFGYQGSLSAGLAHARGDAVVTIDADLQDPPETIPAMIALYEKGYDLVLGVRADRSTDSFFKRVFSENYYRLLKFLGVDIVHNHGDFRLMARPLVDEFNRQIERNRFIRGMILQLDSRYATVAYKRMPRTAGRTKFNFRSMASLSLDGILSFSFMPLRLASLLGAGLCLFSLIGIVWVLYVKLTTDAFPGWASTLLPILTLGGVQLLLLGIIGEYIGRLYIEVKQRPVFLVRNVWTHDR